MLILDENLIFNINALIKLNLIKYYIYTYPKRLIK